MNFRLTALTWLLPGRDSAATAASSPHAGEAPQPEPVPVAHQETPLGGLARLSDRVRHNPLTRIFRASNTTVTVLESTLSAAGSVANPAGDPRFPRPLQRRPQPQQAPLRSEDAAIGAQGAKLAHASIERTAAFIAEGSAARGSLPMPKFMNPRAIRGTLRRLRNREANAAAREWGQTLDDHFMQPVIAVNRLFPIPADASREAADARQAAINRLLDGLTLRRPRPARADASLPPAVERLPQACVVPLAQALAEASDGDPILAARILDRLQQPFDIAGDAAHAAPDELERRAWRCAQDLAHARCAALEGLLRLQFGDGARHAERGNGAAARLVVYLQAGRKLRSIDADLGATPADLNHESTYRPFADDPYGRHAMLALDAARRLPPDAADAHDTGACEIEAITAYRLWQLGFDESGPGSDLARASQLLFDGGTTWVARGAERQARKDRALGPIDGAPPAQRFAHARARIGLAVHDMPRAFGKNRSPIGVSSLLGADTPFFDTTRGRYDTALIAARDALLDYSHAQLPAAATPGRMLTHALNAERLQAWSAARPDVPADAPLRELQKRRPESFEIGRRAARRMWDAARARVAALRGQGDERMERTVGRTLRMFDDRERRRRFIDDMTEGGFTLAALESWFNASGMAAADAARAEPTARHLQAAHDLLANPGIAPLDRITTRNLREQHLALMAQNVPGTGFTSYDGNALGIDASAWANLPAKLLVSAGPIVTVLGGRDSLYSIGTAYEGGQMIFGTRSRVNGALGAQGFVGAALEVGGVAVMAGGWASSSVGGYLAREQSVVLRARRLAPTPATAALEAELWHKDSRQMVNAYWDAAEQAHTPEEFMQILAAGIADNDRISLSSQNNNATSITATPLTVGGVARANVPGASSSERVGGYAGVSSGVTLYSAADLKDSGALASTIGATAVQGSLTASVGAQFAPRAFALGDGTGEIGSVSPGAKTLGGAAVELTPFGRSSFVFAMRDNRGFVAEYTMQDRMFRNADDWARSVRANPAWAHGIGAERLQQVIEQTQQESSGEFSFGERWAIREERVPRLNQYLTLSNQLRARLADASAHTLSRAERALIEAKLRTLERKMQAAFEDPSAWRPLGLFGLREVSRSSSQGWKYGVRASHEQSRTGKSLTFWTPVSGPQAESPAEGGAGAGGMPASAAGPAAHLASAGEPASAAGPAAPGGGV
ncbi:hypothetical protein LMG22037_01966 [Paraburkholderia phenoliruptrix]|uniref:Uncharacterized protein n=1 Tax=Paraburkholderia phenoliruptrix TaxID=252970 RepID=A0A6J5AI98_9BURK|nr:hypothetical protein [Paraburkholderia phenoliruptrix]CAB3671079.1 hypothetical protein LMG22037_01966 [Paraburkholderia phenoliruptrix]